MGTGSTWAAVRDERSGYLVALGATAAAALTRYALGGTAEGTAPFLPFLFAVALTAWVGGLRAGLAATALAAVVVVYLFLPPHYSLAIERTADAVGVALFLAVGAAISWLFEGLHAGRAARERATAAARASEGRLQQFMDNAPQPMGVVELAADDDIRHVYDNPATCRFFGVSPGATAGRRAADLGAAPETIRRWAVAYRESGRLGRPVRFEYRHPGAEPGQWLSATVWPLTGSPDLPRFGYACEDVTDRRRAEDAVRASEERFRTLVATVSAVVWTTDEAGAMGADSPSWAAFTGQTPDQYRGWGWLDAIHPDDQAHTAAVWRAALAALTRYETGYRLRRHDGVYRHVVATGAPVLDPAGRLREWVGNCVDVTDRLAVQDAVTASEARHRWLVENTAEAIWRCELDEPIPADLSADEQVDRMFRDAYLAEANVGMARIYGYDSPAAMVGLRLSQMMPDEPGNRAFLRAFAEAGYRLLDAESVEVGADGEPRYLINGLVGTVEAGHLVRAFGTSRDVTARRQAEQALRRNEERLRLALEVARLGTWEWEPPDGEVLADARAREVAGLPPGPLALADVAARAHPADWPRVEESLRAAVRPDGDGQYVEEFRFVRPDGAVRWVSARGHTVFTGDGPDRRPSRMLGTVIDVTDRKRAEETLRDQAARLTEADRRKDEFLATLAHELRNPLAPVRNALEIMRLAGHDPAVVTDARRMMERQVSHLVRLVDDLMDVSRITRGKLTLRPQPVALADVVHAAVEAVRPLIDQRRHALTVALPADPVRLTADPTRLAQVFANLLTNAAKYTDPGGRVALTATVETADGGRGKAESEPVASDESWSESVFRAPPDALIVVSVTDTGSGIPADQLSHIFDLFTQVPTTLDRSQGGLGIGLSLVRGLVWMHGGTIEARSPGPGKGSEFVVTLPILKGEGGGRTAEPANVPESGAPLTAGVGSALPRPPSAVRKRVLVADDNPDSAASLAALLELLGCEVRVAPDGQAAVAAAAEFRPAVALLDLGMPTVDGYEACRRIRAEPWGRGMVLVAQTGWGQADDRRRTRDAGFDHHLVKPIDPTALVRLLADRNA